MSELAQKIKGILGLSLSLAKARFKLRNEGSYLGIFWYLLEPIFAFAILLVIRQVIYQTATPYYPIYLILGLTMFNFFAASTSFSTNTISSNSGFIKSLKIEKEPFVISGVIQYIFSHFFEFLIVIIVALYLKVPLIWFIFYPIVFGLFCIFTLGVSFILATIGVYIKDLPNIWVILVRLLWFITPIFYTIGENRAIYLFNLFNPIYYFINTMRDLVIYHVFPSFAVISAIILSSVGVFAIGLITFMKNKNKFAEMI